MRSSKPLSGGITSEDSGGGGMSKEICLAEDKAGNTQGKQQAIALLLWLMIVLYAVGRVLQVYRGGIPMLVVVVLHVVPAGVFALIHGGMVYRARGILLFSGLCLLVGNIFENIGVTTGFPYGHYYFTDLMGPKVFHVPIFLGLAYLGMGYLSWTLARLILGNVRGPLVGAQTVTLPLFASFVMVSWDVAMDPIWSTVLRAWVWRDGGKYFGVPMTNFLGWYLAVYVFYQLFAIWLKSSTTDSFRLSAGYWRQAVIFYGVSAAGNLIFLTSKPTPTFVSDPAGVQWKVSDITAACALVSIFAMGVFALLAWVRSGNAEQVGDAHRYLSQGASAR